MKEKKHKINDCTMVVSSCDKYDDLWPMFFTIIKKEWPEMDMPVVLNTESKSFEFEGFDIQTFRIFRENEKVAWGKRLRETLKRIDTPFILFMLDDFYMLERVDDYRFNQCLTWMRNDEKISVFSFMETPPNNYKSEKYEGFEKRPQFAPYKFNCQAAIWRRDRLIKYLRNFESPWEWELYGNWRSFKYKNHDFYSQVANGKYIFPYIYKVKGLTFGGLALSRGKWYLPYVKPLFEQYQFDIDYSIRGTTAEEEFMPSPPKKAQDYVSWKRHLLFLKPICVRILRIWDIIKHLHHLI